MIIYAAHITPRLQYVTGFISNALFGRDDKIAVTTDATAFAAADMPRIWYAETACNVAAVHIIPQGILFENNIVAQKVSTTIVHGLPHVIINEKSFDIFAAIFYLLSRYEEYLPASRDYLGRFNAEVSLAYKENFLHLPLADLWVEALKNELRKIFPAIAFYEKEYKWLPTYDIDMAWSYRHKGVWRNAAGAAKELAALKVAALQKRIRVLTGKAPDPFDTFTWLQTLHDKYHTSAVYFFLMAEKRSEFDKNICPQHKVMQQLTRKIAANNEVALHPSYSSNNSFDKLSAEKNRLEKITGNKINEARQHYLILQLPHTYRRLMGAGITTDYTMGYSSHNGFRASTASPFMWYDLEKEQATRLRIVPFCFMDATSIFYKKQNAQTAFEELQQLFDTVKKIKGTCCALFHNSTFCEDGIFAGWQKSYENFLACNFNA